MKETALYIHIPFCDHKCIYCDFYSIISYDNVTSYLTALKKEIDYYSELYGSDRKIISIFFGGGTPSFMEPEYIKEIIDHLKKTFHINNDIEITLETNPGTVDINKLERFRKAGVNRISIGVQSFDETELKFLTRIHDKQTAIDTVYNARNAGFENISIDLIFNLPGQTKAKWKSNMEQAAALPLTHLSAYSLILERGTILNKMVIDGKITMQDDDYDADLYEMTIDFFTSNGFIQYEVSNFAKPGCECIHNNAYWRYKDYFGFGTSAHSFVDGKRWWNYSSLKFYNAAVDVNNNAVTGSEIIDERQKLEEYLMLALRSKGLDKQEFQSLFGYNWVEQKRQKIELLLNEGFMINNDNILKFTQKGYALCDEILTTLL